MVQRILNYYPNYPTHRFFFGEDETPHCTEEGILAFLNYELTDGTSLSRTLGRHEYESSPIES